MLGFSTVGTWFRWGRCVSYVKTYLDVVRTGRFDYRQRQRCSVLSVQTQLNHCCTAVQSYALISFREEVRLYEYVERGTSTFFDDLLGELV